MPSLPLPKPGHTTTMMTTVTLDSCIDTLSIENSSGNVSAPASSQGDILVSTGSHVKSTESTMAVTNTASPAASLDLSTTLSFPTATTVMDP